MKCRIYGVVYKHDTLVHGTSYTLVEHTQRKSHVYTIHTHDRIHTAQIGDNKKYLAHDLQEDDLQEHDLQPYMGMTVSLSTYYSCVRTNLCLADKITLLQPKLSLVVQPSVIYVVVISLS